MNKILKSSTKVALALALTSNIVACNSEEVAQGLGAAAIVAGAIAIAATTPQPVCVGGYRTLCHDYVDYWGNVQRECHNEYDSCLTRYLQEDVAVEDATLSVTGAPGAIRTASGALSSSNMSSLPDLSLVNGVNWGQTFKVSYDGADKLVSALKEAKMGKLQPILDLGLSESDVIELAKLKMPSDDGVDALAESLNTDVDATQAMLKKIIQIAKTQKSP